MATRAIYQNTRAHLYLYPRNLDVLAATGKAEPEHASEKHPLAGPALIGLRTNKAIGAAGTWAAQVRIPRPEARAWEESLEDGDWCDIVLERNARRFHVMRGIVDTISVSRRVESTGADVVTFELSGRDFQAVFEDTTLWFSHFTEENLLGGAGMRAASMAGKLAGLGVRQAVTTMLFGMIQQLGQYGRSLWKIPESVPRVGGLYAPTQIARLYSPTVDDPARIAAGLNLMSLGDGNVWGLAREWCDPEFNELWCDLARENGAVFAGDVLDTLDASADPETFHLDDSTPIEPDQTTMAVFMRRRPFPSAEDAAGLTSGPWASLPTVIIAPQELTAVPETRSGAERVNIIEVAGTSVQELAPSVSLLAPIVNITDVEQRGAKPLVLRSRYTGDLTQGVSDAAMSEALRRRVRDWYALNHRFLSGSLSLRTMRPGVRVGSCAVVTENDRRLRGEQASGDTTYYVEKVSHTWRAPGFGSTELGVTRGYRGGDDALYDAISRARVQWAPLTKARAIVDDLPSSEGIA